MAGAAWLAICFLGGGAVPWGVANDGVRHLLSVVVLVTKVMAVSMALAWSRATWPEVSSRSARLWLVCGATVATCSIAATLIVRRIV